MTCIVGYTEKGKVYMGGDSAASLDLDVRVRKDTKVFKNGPMLIGYTTSFRMGQLLRFSLKIPKQPKKMSDYKYMCTLFVSAVKRCLRKNDFATVDNGVVVGGTFLVGYRGNLYEVYSDFQVAKEVDGYSACGCGEDYALGAMYTLSGNKMQPKQRIVKALQAAEKFSGGVQGPFKVKSM